MLIKVTQEHIDKGQDWLFYYKGGSGWSWTPELACPIAHALREQTGDPTWRVGVWTCFTYNDFPFKKEIKLPPEARKFVDDFDFERGVKPFEFEVDI